MTDGGRAAGAAGWLAGHPQNLQIYDPWPTFLLTCRLPAGASPPARLDTLHRTIPRPRADDGPGRDRQPQRRSGPAPSRVRPISDRPTDRPDHRTSVRPYDEGPRSVDAGLNYAGLLRTSELTTQTANAWQPMGVHTWPSCPCQSRVGRCRPVGPSTGLPRGRTIDFCIAQRGRWPFIVVRRVQGN